MPETDSPQQLFSCCGLCFIPLFRLLILFTEIKNPVKPVYPFFNLSAAGKHFRGDDLALNFILQAFSGSLNIAAAGGCKEDDFLSRPVISFHEGINNTRLLIIPDRKADENNFIIGEITDFLPAGNTPVKDLFSVASGQVIFLVEVSSSIGFLRLDFKIICFYLICQFSCNCFRRSGR